MFERCQERQREMAGLRLATRLRRERSSLSRLVVIIGGALIKLGSHLKQLDTRERQVTYEH